MKKNEKRELVEALLHDAERQAAEEERRIHERSYLASRRTERASAETARLLQRGMSREELAAACAAAKVEAEDLRNENDRLDKLFRKVRDGIHAALVPLHESSGLPEAFLPLMFRYSPLFDVEKIVRVARLDTVAAAGRKAARSLHTTGAKAKAKDLVLECWETWTAKPQQYKNATAFARAMVDKFPDELKSEVTVTRWVRRWKQEK